MTDLRNGSSRSTGVRAAEELEYRLRQSQLVTEFGCFAFKTHDVDAVLQEACRISALGMNSDSAKVLEYLPIEQQFLVRAGVGWKPGIVGHARVDGDSHSPAGHAFDREVDPHVYEAASAKLAFERTLAFFDRHLAGR